MRYVLFGLWLFAAFVLGTVIAAALITETAELVTGIPQRNKAPAGAVIAGLATAYWAWKNPPKRLR